MCEGLVGSLSPSLDPNNCYKDEDFSYSSSSKLSFDLWQTSSVSGALFISIEWEEVHLMVGVKHRQEI